MIGTKIVAAAVAGAAVGASTFALAPTQAATGSSDSARHTIARHTIARHTIARHTIARHTIARHAIARHQNVIHGSWVTRNRVHHEAIRGVVRTVSSSYITVRAVDGYTQTYHVTAATRVRVLGDNHPGLDKIGDVKVGYRALLVGVGNDQATHVIARKPPSTTS